MSLKVLRILNEFVAVCDDVQTVRNFSLTFPMDNCIEQAMYADIDTNINNIYDLGIYKVAHIKVLHVLNIGESRRVRLRVASVYMEPGNGWPSCYGAGGITTF